MQGGAGRLQSSHALVRLVLGGDLAASSRLSNYALFALTDFLCFTAVYIPYTHLPTFAQSRGVSGGDAAFLVSVGGLCNTVGRLVGGAARWGQYYRRWITQPCPS